MKKDLNRLPPDSKLYILTFDDATFGQFEFSGTDAKGDPVIDPDCAIGIMIEFAKKHPDFMLNAAFSIPLEHIPFMQSKFVGKKLNLLLDYGFEIINHTKNHKKLRKYIPDKTEIASYEIGRAMEIFESYLGYRVDSIDKICYPDGSADKYVWDFVKKVDYNGKEYRFIAALNASGMQAKNPNDEKFNPYNISRIEINRNSFNEFVLNAPGLYRTPPLIDKYTGHNFAYSRMDDNSNSLDLIRLR